MNGKDLETLLSSEQEWRRYIVKQIGALNKKMDTFEENQVNIRIEQSSFQSKFKTWSWIWRAFGIAGMTFLFWLIQQKL